MEDKIKDASKKHIVEAYQAQVRESINKILGLELKLTPLKKEYLKNLEENIKIAPYNLGYLELPTPGIKKKK